jgi:hypothetical protein
MQELLNPNLLTDFYSATQQTKLDKASGLH